MLQVGGVDAVRASMAAGGDLARYEELVAGAEQAEQAVAVILAKPGSSDPEVYAVELADLRWFRGIARRARQSAGRMFDRHAGAVARGGAR